MLSRSIETSPVWYARLGGALYLAIILFGGFSEGFVNGKLMADDAATTAHNILASAGLWRLGTAANLLVVLCAVPLLWIEFQLLRPVSKSLALLGLLLNVVSLAVEAISKLFQLLVLPILQSADYVRAWGPVRVALLANLALKSHDIAFNIALLFFGFTCLVHGYLIIKSGFLPAVLGVLMQVAVASTKVAWEEFICRISPRLPPEAPTQLPWEVRWSNCQWDAFTPLISSHRHSDNSPTRGGSKMAGISWSASAGAKSAARQATR